MVTAGDISSWPYGVGPTLFIQSSTLSMAKFMNAEQVMSMNRASALVSSEFSIRA